MSVSDIDGKLLLQRLPAGLLDRIVSHLNPQRVIVFGSQATGRTHEDSDWDLLVVVDDDAPNERINWRGIFEARRTIRAAIDLLPIRASTFDDRKDVVGSLAWIGEHEGVVVYERPENG